MPIKIKSPRSENLKIIQRCILGCSKCRRERERGQISSTLLNQPFLTLNIYIAPFSLPGP
jgi:hypothetical protein